MYVKLLPQCIVHPITCDKAEIGLVLYHYHCGAGCRASHFLLVNREFLLFFVER